MKALLRFILPAIVALASATTSSAQTAASVIAPVVPASSARAAIPALKGTPFNSAVDKFHINAYNIGGGTLYAKGVLVPAATGGDITILATDNNQFNLLTFQPGATGGTFTFTYTASDGSKTSPAANYSLSVSPKAFPFGSGFDFSTAVNDATPWTSRVFTVGTGADAVTVTTSAYSASSSTPATEYQIGDRNATATAPALPGKALYWFTDYDGAANFSTVTYTFSKPLRGFSLVAEDVDKGSTTNFTDQLQFDAYSTLTAATPMTLSAADVVVGNSNAFAAGTNAITGTALSAASPGDNTIISFPQSVMKMVITYRNTAPTTAALTQQVIGIQSMGWAAKATNGAPLPVTLSQFEAVAQGDVAQLTWATALEKNNDRFEVERSITGTSFERVGAVSGHGNSSAPHTYTFADAVGSKTAKVVYYRLRQVDFDGESTYSPVRSVAFGGKLAEVTLYPSPTNSQTTVDLGQLAPGTYRLTAYDVLGRPVLRQDLTGGAAASVNLSTLPNGAYLLRLAGAQAVKSLRVVKQD